MINKNSKLWEVVARNFQTAAVFEGHGIDFCFEGEKSVLEACRDRGIDANELIKELSAAGENGAGIPDLSSYELDRLIDHIVDTHHTYVKSTLPLIKESALKAAQQHGGKQGEIIEVAKLVEMISEELEMHLAKEEKMLFPFIKKLLSLQKEGLPAGHPPFGTLHNPIKVMESEHINAGKFFSEIAKYSNNYTLSEGAGTDLEELYGKLQNFEHDLHLHINLENNILFPKALKLEEKLGYITEEQ